MVTKEQVSEFLNRPSESVIPLGIFSFLGGTALWIAVPVILLILGAGIWFVIQILPFLVAGGAMFFFYWLFGKFDIKEPWRTLGPILFGAVALLPMFIPQTQSLVVGQVSSTAVATGATTQAGAQGLISGFFDLTTKTFLAIPVVAVLIFLIIGLKALLNLGTPGAFFAGFLGIALGLGLGLHVVGASGMGLAHPEKNVSLKITGTEGLPAKITNNGTEIEDKLANCNLRFSISGLSFDGEEFLRSEEIPGGYKDYYKQKFTAKAKLDVERDVRNHPKPVDLTATFKAEHQKAHYEASYVKSARLKSKNNTWIEETEEAPTNGQFKLKLYGKPDGAWWGWREGHAKNKLTLWFKGYETRQKGEEKRSARNKTQKAGGVPMWAWVVGFASVIPAGFVYAGEEKEWW